jgi:hypothetical protein
LLLGLAREAHRLLSRAEGRTPGPERAAVDDLLRRVVRLQQEISTTRMDELRRWALNLRRQVEALAPEEP